MNEVDHGAEQLTTGPLQLGVAVPRMTPILFADSALDPSSLRLMRGTHQSLLSVQEYRLLVAILHQPGWVITKEHAAVEVWEHTGAYDGSDTYRKYCERLTKAFRSIGSSLRVTVRNGTFVLSEQPASARTGCLAP